MKTIIAIALTSLACGAAQAVEFKPSCPLPAEGQQATGCQVPGSTYYFMKPGDSRVIEIRSLRTAAELRRVWRTEATGSIGGGDPSPSK